MSVNDETTPSTHQLTSDEVHLIQETWKIPNGDVSCIVLNIEGIYRIPWFPM